MNTVPQEFQLSLACPAYFEQKWQDELPVASPHMTFDFVGSAAAQCSQFPVTD